MRLLFTQTPCFYLFSNMKWLRQRMTWEENYYCRLLPTWSWYVVAPFVMADNKQWKGRWGEDVGSEGYWRTAYPSFVIVFLWLGLAYLHFFHIFTSMIFSFLFYCCYYWIKGFAVCLNLLHSFGRNKVKHRISWLYWQFLTWFSHNFRRMVWALSWFVTFLWLEGHLTVIET